MAREESGPAPPGAPALRAEALARLATDPFDVLILGGGINGAATAAALSARGARVGLVERRDFASATSQASSCLAWGGIKYLEGLELRLVRGLCRARNQLLRAYPTAVREVRFLAVHPRGFRHGRWKLVAGAWLYWVLGGGFTRAPRALGLADLAADEPVVSLDGVDGGFEYSDAWLPDGDARFTFGLVRAALRHGCTAANYVEALGSARGQDGWVTRARDAVSGRALEIRSRLLVNACGPWADEVNARDGVTTAHRHVLSKGVHLLVDRITGGDRVLAFFADDGRLFFAIPFGARTCLGTTDTPASDPAEGVTDADRRFVLDNANKRLRLARPLGVEDVIAERCGVRPLVVDAAGARGEDWMQLSRRHVVEVDGAAGRITTFGGKLTDCLNVGEEVCRAAQRLGVALTHPERRWYGEPGEEARRAFLAEARALGLDAPAPGGPGTPAERLWRRHGEDAPGLLSAIRRDPSAAEPLLGAGDTLRCEVEAAARRELVVRLDDFLRRRTSLSQVLRRDALRRDPGLLPVCRTLFGDAAEDRLAEYFAEDARSAPPSGAPADHTPS
jgi:glycerol-3-phosphate dehydrogenase